MLDINEIRKRAQQASERAADSMKRRLKKARNWQISLNFPALKKKHLHLSLRQIQRNRTMTAQRSK